MKSELQIACTCMKPLVCFREDLARTIVRIALRIGFFKQGEPLENFMD